MKEIYFKVGMENLVEHIKWNKNIMDYLISYQAQDGLTISKRLWGHSKQIRDKIFDSLKKNILAGESVWDTMMELQEIKSPKIKIPEYLEKEFEKMSHKKIEEIIDLYTVKKTNYLTRRLVEAEIERAYRTTTLKLAEDKEWIKGMKWNLSHKHKYGAYDCNCEKNATQNAFGLGRGVYPIKYYPHVPDHPWCNCFETEIFDEKVLEDYGIIDKKNKKKDDNMSDRISFDKMTDKQRNQFLLKKIEKRESLTEEEGKSLEKYLNNVDWDKSFKKIIDVENPEFEIGKEVDLLTFHYVKRKYKDKYNFKSKSSYNDMVKDTLKSGDIYGIINSEQFKEGPVSVLNIVKIYSENEISKYIDDVPDSKNFVVIVNVLFGNIKSAFPKEDKSLKKKLKKWVLLWQRK
ncbi:Head morphogenesis protein [Marinitoga phage MPV1]